MPTIRNNTALSTLTYPEGDAFIITDGAVLDIDVNADGVTKPRLGSITCTTSGKVRISNSSNTTARLVQFSDPTRTFRIEGNGVFETRGSFIEFVSPGGTNFTISTGLTTNHSLNLVEVETGVGTNVFKPWHVAETESSYYIPSKASQRGSSPLDWDANFRVCFVAANVPGQIGFGRSPDTSVVATGGAVPATGVRIRIPNIYISTRFNHPGYSRTTHTLALEGSAFTAGTWNFEVVNSAAGGSGTFSIAFGATAATVQTSIQNVLGAGTVTVTGTFPAFTFTAAGTLAATGFQMRLISTSGVLPAASSLYLNPAVDWVITDINPSGVLDCQWTSFGQRINFRSLTVASSVRLVDVGLFNGLSISNTNASVELTRVHVQDNHTIATGVGSAIQSVFGNVALEDVRMTGVTNGLVASFITLPSLTKFLDVSLVSYATMNTTVTTGVNLTTLPPNLKIERFAAYAQRVTLTNLTGWTFIAPVVGIRPGGTVSTNYNSTHFQLVNCVRLNFFNTALGSVPTATSVFDIDAASSDILINGGVWDGRGVVQNIATPIVSANITFENIRLTNKRTSSQAPIGPNTASYLANRLKVTNVLWDGTITGSASIPGTNAFYNLYTAPSAGINNTHIGVEGFSGGLYMNSGLNPSTGVVAFNGFGKGVQITPNGGAYTDQLGQLRLPRRDDSAIIEIPFTLRGVVQFNGAAGTYSYRLPGVAGLSWNVRAADSTGGTFTLSAFDSSGSLVGTTGTLNQATATNLDVQNALNAINASYVYTVTGTNLVSGFTVTRTTGPSSNGSFIGINSASLVPSGVIAFASTTATNSSAVPLRSNNTSLIEYQIKRPSADWTTATWTPLPTSFALNLAIALPGYDVNEGFNMRIRTTRIAFSAGLDENDDAAGITSILLPVDINPTIVTTPNASVTINGPNATDIIRVIRVSDNQTLYQYTGQGLKTFDVGSNYDTPVVYQRLNSTGVLLTTTDPSSPLRIDYGNNGTVNLFYGAQVQLAQAPLLDVAVSTRQAAGSGGSGTAPSAAVVAAAVRSELSTELGRIDVSISSRESEVSAASRAAQDQTEHDATQLLISGLTIPGQPPTPAVIATAVRTELGTELGRIDVSVSSRASEANEVSRNTDLTNLINALPLSILDRNLNNLPGGTPVRTVREALQAARNKVELVDLGGGVRKLRVYREDDTTLAWEADVSLAARDAFTSVDPT